MYDMKDTVMNQKRSKQLDLHLFIIWHNAKEKYQDIISDIETEFLVLCVYEVVWNSDLYLDNLIVLYSKSQCRLDEDAMRLLMSQKMEEIGRGSFFVVVIKDTDPVYETRSTSSGSEFVNVNVFNKKNLYRYMTGGGFLIHATNSKFEFDRDATLLFGVGYAFDDTKWDGEIVRVSRNITGVGGWKDMREFFGVLNHTIDYVVLRNFESLPDESRFDDHGDIDLLVENPRYLKYLTGAVAVFSESYRSHYKILIGNNDIFFDFRFLGDNYYDLTWEDNLLKSRILRNGVYVLEPRDHFFSLLYHALIHKMSVGQDYKERLLQISEEINIKLFEEDFETDMISFILFDYMNRMEYDFFRPLDLSVSYNEKYLKTVLDLLWKGDEIFPVNQFDYVKQESKLISSHFLTSIGGIDYWSCVFIEDNIVYKQATLDLAEREAYFLNLLQEDYFPKVIDSWTKNDFSVVALEKIEGNPLRKISYVFRENPKKMYLFVMDCLNILEILEQKDIAHRDIRPDNIMIRNEKPVLLDFGWATSRSYQIFTPNLLGGRERPPDGNHCDIYSMGKIIEQVNLNTYYIVNWFVSLMISSDPYLRFTDIQKLNSIWVLLKKKFEEDAL